MNKKSKLGWKLHFDPKLEDVMDELAVKIKIRHIEYKFLPYWFRFEDQGIYAHHLDNLPKELTDYISATKNFIEKYSKKPSGEKP